MSIEKEVKQKGNEGGIQLKVVFRVDVSPNIGFGHMMRCFALVEELLKRECQCTIMSKMMDESLIKKIEKIGAGFIQLPMKGDLTELIDLSKEKDIDWIITDTYDISSEHIKKLKEENFKILSIDDTAHIHYYSDIVLNQNIGAEKLEFSAEKHTKFLLGSKYVLLRDEILESREAKIDPDRVNRILISLGGSDQGKFILDIIHSLDTLDEDIEFIVAESSSHDIHEMIKNYTKGINRRVEAILAPENMGEIYLRTDIAISAGGTTCYELAYHGIPNIIVVIADNQLNTAKELDDHGSSIYLGKKEETPIEEFKTTIEKLICDNNLRISMRNSGMGLIDGKGRERVVDLMVEYN